VVQKTLWLIPLMQTIHITCVALVFSSVVMIEFRVLGYGWTPLLALVLMGVRSSRVQAGAEPAPTHRL